MKWQASLAGALASVLMTCVAQADIRIVSDPGGEVAAYVQKFRQIRASGQHVIIDGPCLSACTLLTGIIPKDRVCVTRRAALGFHAASYYDDASRRLVPTRQGSELVMRLYPPEIRTWINQHGGLRPQLVMLRGRELNELYPTCQ
ncbi:MAG TPA: hypothetical protein VEI98_07305 [Xanthobacteraceae bacterium]|nr:hypothetical protein [Xanthobacteraceae bacterium]